MAIKSALLGEAPLNHNDYLIQRALVILAGSQVNPNKSQPFGPPRPANQTFETWAPSLRAGEGVAIFLVTLFTLGRLYIRMFRTKHFGPDDWMIMPGAIGCIVYLSMDIASTTYGCLGKHIYDCTYDQLAWYVRTANVEQPIFYFTVFSVKLSIALANRRITGISSERWTIVHWSFIVLFLILLPLTVGLETVNCIPVPVPYSLQFVGAMKDPRQIHCLNRVAIGLATRILHIVTDVSLLCIPIIIVLRLRIPKRKKARLTAIFALGGMSTIASALRNKFIYTYLDDITWQYHEIYIWNTVDISFAVIVASLPALNKLLDVGIEKLKKYGLLSKGTGSSSSAILGFRKGSRLPAPWPTGIMKTSVVRIEDGGSIDRHLRSNRRVPSDEDFLFRDIAMHDIPVTDIRAS